METKQNSQAKQPRKLGGQRLTMISACVRDRDKLAKLSKQTGKKMYRLLGEMIAEYAARLDESAK